MNNKERQFLEVPLGIEAHHIAGKLAAEQTATEKSKQVYLNTLAVYAVHRYLKWLGIETSLTKSDSWNPILRNKWNVADLVIPGCGQLECRPFLPRETSVSLPDEVTEDRIGYLGVQLSERLDKVQLLGFTKTVNRGVLEIGQLQSLDKLIDLIDELSRVPKIHLLQWFEGIFDEVWQPIEALLTVKTLAWRFLSSEDDQQDHEQKKQIRRAKKIDLGLLVNRQQVALVVWIWPEENQEIGIRVQVHPLGEHNCLPPGLKLKVILESDEEEVEARDTDNCIQLELTELPGKQVIVQVSLDDHFVTENFVV